VLENPYAFALNRTHKMTHNLRPGPGSARVVASDIMYFSGQHGRPRCDAIGHIGVTFKLHGRRRAVAATATPAASPTNLASRRSRI